MNVYLVRHGQSEGNLKGLHQGPDIPLSKEGKKQAKAIAKRLKNVPIDFIYTSPYLRARETAEIISKKLKLPIEFWEDLKERKFPTEIEGLSYDDPKAIEIEEKVAQNWLKGNWKHSDEESFKEIKGRAQAVINHLLEKHERQNVLCIAHGTIMKTIVCSAILGDKLTPGVFWEFSQHVWTQNTGITHLEFTDKYGWGLLTWNDATHLCENKPVANKFHFLNGFFISKTTFGEWLLK